MPSQLHEALLLLFRNRPALAPDLLRDALSVPLPSYVEARLESADLTDVQPAEYRADLVIQLFERTPVLGIIVEVQLSPDERKRFVWPVYVANLRARLKCPVLLLVVTADEAVGRWAARPIDIGGGNQFVPLVLRPSGVPEVSDEGQACAEPELAVLSAMAHGRDTDAEKSIRIASAARAATVVIDAEWSELYFDLVMSSLSEAAKRGFEAMLPFKYEYQSDFAKRYIAQGEAAGEARGRASTLIRLLELRFGPLSSETKDEIATRSIVQLDAMAERVLIAGSLREALEGAT